MTMTTDRVEKQEAKEKEKAKICMCMCMCMCMRELCSVQKCNTI